MAGARLARLGFERRREMLERLPPVDFRGILADPVEALKRAEGLRFVIDIPLLECRGHRAAAFPCVPGHGHPYLETARELLAGSIDGYRGSTLERYYRNFRPETAAENLGIDATNPGLQAHPSVTNLPWDPPPAAGALLSERAAIACENRGHGRALGAEHGYHHFGPVSGEKGALEIERLAAVLERIRSEGFRLLEGRSGLPRAVILSAHGRIRALVTNGQHRVAVRAALGADMLPVWPLPGIVRREAVQTWPAVQAGLFSSTQALAVFDRIFEGSQPACLEAGYWRGGDAAAAASRRARRT